MSKADDIRRARQGWFCAVFEAMLAGRFRKSFNGFRLLEDGADVAQNLTADAPIVLYSNHPGWWDPMVLFMVQRRLFPERMAFGPMDADALEAYRILRRIGIFPIKTESPKGIAAFIASAEALLADPVTTLCITPEGAFSDPHARPLAFKPGLAAIAKRAPHAQFLPLAIEYAFWEESKPEALIAFGPVSAGRAAADAPDPSAHLAAGLEDAMDRLRAASARREAAGFSTMIDGRAGVGGVYDLWRQGRAALRGETVSTRHADLGGKDNARAR